MAEQTKQPDKNALPENEQPQALYMDGLVVGPVDWSWERPRTAEAAETPAAPNIVEPERFHRRPSLFGWAWSEGLLSFSAEGSETQLP